MVRARRVSLFQRDILVSLSSAAVEILLDEASLLSEGQLEGERYFGSTMVTIDLRKASRSVSDVCDNRTVRRVTELCLSDERLQEKLRAIAQAEAERLGGSGVADLQIDTRVRTRGSYIYLDLDIEGRKHPV